MVDPEVKTILLKTQLSRYLELNEIDMLIKAGDMAEFAVGDVILHQGTYSHGLYIILEGEVSVIAKVLGEGTSHIATLTQGYFLGEISLLEKKPCPTSNIANTPVKCLVISEIYFAMLSVVYPETKYHLNKAIAEEMIKRLKLLYKKNTSYITDAHMVSKSIFKKFINSMSKSEIIPFEKIGLELKFENIIKNQLFQSFSEEELKKLFQKVSFINASKHCAIMETGSLEKSCYIILRGAVQSSFIEQKVLAKLSVLGPLSLLFNISFLNPEEASIIRYETCEHSILMKLSEEQLMSIKKNDPILWFKLYEIICISLVELVRAADKLYIRLNSELYNR